MTIISASVFVLSALTLTGVYMASKSEVDSHENKIDFAKIEQESQMISEENWENDMYEEFTKDEYEQSEAVSEDVVDAEQDGQEANSRLVANDKVKALDELRYLNENTEGILIAQAEKAQQYQQLVLEQESVSEEVIAAEDAQETAAIASPEFVEGDTLQWPVVGEILLNYSMNQAVYHQTLQQYRYNPSLVIAATEGEVITAAADGVVKEIFYDAQTGNTIVFDIGNGYELTYGQLEDIALQVGNRVETGDMVGKVAEPTIYYTEEGCNVYFMLTKDGVAQDPMSVLE